MSKRNSSFRKEMFQLRIFQFFFVGMFFFYIWFLASNQLIHISFDTWDSFVESVTSIGSPSSEQAITPTNGIVKVYFLDVGQADSILIQYHDSYFLIDAGNNEDGPLLAKFLKENHIDHLEYAVGTHSDEDHIGGMDDVLKSVSVSHFYLPNRSATSKTYKDVVAAASNVEHLGTNDTIYLGDVLFTVLSVDYGTNANDSSYVFRMNYGNVCFLFMGDASTQVENSITSNVDCEVLKLGHHGSKTSTSESFLQKVTPIYGVISVGKNNSYKHPNDSVLSLLDKYQVQTLRTDILGTIVISTDGTTIEQSLFKTQVNGT